MVDDSKAFPWPKTRVAVLGGGGFLGNHLVARLRALDCEPAIPRTADGWDFRQLESALDFFAEYRPEFVFNCAARQGGLAYQQLYPADIYYDNMLLGLNITHAAQRSGVRKLINALPACSYPGYLDHVLNETDYWSGPLHESVVNYGFTKKAQVVQGGCYRKQYDFCSIHLLLTNLYGPGEHFHPDRSHALAALLRKFVEAKRDNSPRVTLWGSGRPVREWLFVADAAQALVLAAERYDESEPLNVCTGKGISIANLAALIKEIVGYTREIRYDATKPDGALMKSFGNSRIAHLLGWRPTTSLRDGIEQTLAWFEANYESATSQSESLLSPSMLRT